MLLNKSIQKEVFGCLSRSYTSKGSKGLKQIAPKASDITTINNMSPTLLYRTFLKAGEAAVNKKNKKHVKIMIREIFQRKDVASDPELEIKVKNTLELLRLAHDEPGLARRLVNNICQLKYFKDKENKRPPFYNRKFRPEIKQLHETSREHLDETIDMLNKDLKLLLLI